MTEEDRVAKRYSYEELELYLKENNCEILTRRSEYTKVTQTLSIKCKCKETFNTNLSKFKNAKYKMCSNCREEAMRSESYISAKVFIEQDSNSNCKLLTTRENYVNKKDKLDIRCSCGEVYKCGFRQFKTQKKHTCNKCSHNRVSEAFSLKIEEVIKIIENPSSGNGCKYIDGEYKNNTSPLTLRCACKNTFITSFAQFTHAGKKQCNICGFEKKGWRYFYQDAMQLVKEYGCKLLTLEDQYVDSTQPLQIQCACGRQFEMNLIQFRYRKGGRCSDCYRNEISERFTISYEDIKKYIEEESDSECVLITPKEEYVNTRILIDIQCKCGNTFKTSVHEFKSNNKRQCNKCGIGLMPVEDFLRLFEDENRDCELVEYENKDGYVLAHSTVQLRCFCGETFKTNRHNFTSYGRSKCDKCLLTTSRGEKAIGECLDAVGINSEREHCFNDCRGERRPLPFDFAILDSNDSVAILIEYDGKQHFQPVNFVAVLMKQRYKTMKTQRGTTKLKTNTV